VTGSHGINVEPPRPPLIRGIIRRGLPQPMLDVEIDAEP
jgi:hypothetical protein